MATISIADLAVSYSGNRVIDGLDLQIAAGSFYTLLGPSGCGKTTLLRTLAGFLPVERGRIRFGDRDVTALPAHRRDIGMVFQDYALFPDKTVYDNVAYGLRARAQDEATIRLRVGEYLDRVGLGGLAARHPAALSGGQRQRVALARALVIQPQVLLMDEPLSNLDAKLRVQVRETIADLQREAGITTVFVTHDQEEALALSDRIGLMRQGRIEQNASPQDIYRLPASAYVADFVGAANVLAVEAVTPDAAGDGVTVTLAGRRIIARVPRRLSGGAVLLIARPEDLRLARCGATANAVSGAIVRKQYLGGRTSYRVRCAADGAGIAGPDVMVELHGAGHNDWDEGAAVDVLFDPQASIVTAS